MVPSFDLREAVGTKYVEADALLAQKKTWDVVRAVAAELRPGNTEAEAKKLLSQKQKMFGAEKIWHPPQIRFGRNTVKSFGKPSEPDVVLQENDLFFLDIGPVFFGYEGDAGETFVVGDDSERTRIAHDSKLVFDKVKAIWQEEGLTGRALYQRAEKIAQDLGWRLSLEGASGHRIGDFPHAIHHRGKLKTFDVAPCPNRWILEIHLMHPSGEYGAFFEDVL